MFDSTAPSRVTFQSIQERVDHNIAQGESSHAFLPLSLSTVALARNQIFRITSIMGTLCSFFLIDHNDDNNVSQLSSPEISRTLGRLFIQMFILCRVCGIDLCSSLWKKVELNRRKYPVELCKGKSGKYTNYSEHTGITKTEGQSTISLPPIDCITMADCDKNSNDKSQIIADTHDDNMISVEGFMVFLRQFATERLWNQYHTPRNIALALLGEVGELAELFQWCGDEVESLISTTPERSTAMNNCDKETAGLLSIGWSKDEVDKVEQEVADVTIYLIRLADICGIALGEITMQSLMSSECLSLI